jgi:hypothetical protein
MSGSAREVQKTRERGAQRMQLRYGFNEIYGWWNLSQGPAHKKIQRRLRLMGTSVIRVFAFDQPVPHPVKEWDQFAAYLQGVLDAGAKPMVTFAKFHPPYDDPKNIRNFTARCAEIVWSCIERWGGDEVKDWYWCIWNEPNNLLVGGDLTFDQYREIYNDVATEVLRQLTPFLGGRKAMIGGPAIDSTHRLYWMDWIARLITEVDDSKIGFVSWHRYGDWRPAVPSESLNLEMWGSPDAPNGEVFQALLMAQVPSYGAHARGIARLLKGRNILNVCGELNTMSHHEQYYTLGLNQNAFGGAYYISALIHLLRGGADLEMRWTATGHDDRTDAYGLMTMHGDPTPAGLAKQLFAQHVRFGDWIRFPNLRLDAPDIDAVIAWNDEGRLGGVFVNTSPEPCEVVVADWDSGLGGCSEVFRVDASTGNSFARERFSGTIRLERYGVAAVTNKADIVID